MVAVHPASSKAFYSEITAADDGEDGASSNVQVIA